MPLEPRDPIPDPDHAVLQRYLAGDATARDREIVQEWLADDPVHGERLAELRRIVNATVSASAEANRFNVRTAKRRLADRIARTESDRARSGREVDGRDGDRLVGSVEGGTRAETPGAQPQTFFLHARSEGGIPRPGRTEKAGERTWRWPTAAIAAGLLLAVSGGMTVAFLYSVERDRGRGREFVTAAAELETVTLTDGTRITLAPASHVRVAANYGRGRRDVYLLDGEGYFTVTHDAQHPFAVHARNAIAEDVGTRFAVRSYADEQAVRVVVADGAVSLGDSVRRRGSRSVLRSGTRADMDHAGATVVSRGIDPDQYLAWTRGELVFDETPLPAVARQLSRWYGLDVRTTDTALDHRRFTGTYATASVERVLSFITSATATRYERHGNLVSIAPR